MCLSASAERGQSTGCLYPFKGHKPFCCLLGSEKGEPSLFPLAGDQVDPQNKSMYENMKVNGRMINIICTASKIKPQNFIVKNSTKQKNELKIFQHKTLHTGSGGGLGSNGHLPAVYRCDVYANNTRSLKLIIQLKWQTLILEDN